MARRQKQAPVPEALTDGGAMTTLKLLANRPVSPSMHELVFERPEGFTFRAGQFIRIGREGLFRAYSIASGEAEAVVRLLVTNVENGALSPILCAMEPGETVESEGEPDGHLDPARIPGGDTLWLVATGSGVSPFLSMIRTGRIWREWKDVVLVMGVRTLEDASAARELLDEELPGPFTLACATTRDVSGELSGRIPALLETGELEAHVGRRLDVDAARVLLCGNPGFIRETRAMLKTRGLVAPRFGKPGQLLVEQFWDDAR